MGARPGERVNKGVGDVRWGKNCRGKREIESGVGEGTHKLEVFSFTMRVRFFINMGARIPT